MSSTANEKPSVRHSPSTDQHTFFKEDTISALQAINTELQALRRVNVRIATQKPRRNEFIWNVLLQVAVGAIGILFGVFTYLAWRSARRANKIALEANQLAFLFYCSTMPNGNGTSVCEVINNFRSSQMASLANETFSYLNNEPGHIGRPAGSDQAALAIGATCGGLSLLAAAYSVFVRFKHRERAMDSLQQELQSVGEAVLTNPESKIMLKSQVPPLTPTTRMHQHGAGNR